MSDDIFDDPDVRAWTQGVVEDLIPKLRNSSMTVSLVPERPEAVDVKFAVELGFSIMLGKPIILVVRPGTRLPDKVVALADQIVEMDGADTGDRLQAAITQVLGGGS